jgi:hypothetical protein
VLSDGTSTYLYGRGRIGEQKNGGWLYHLKNKRAKAAVDKTAAFAL